MSEKKLPEALKNDPRCQKYVAQFAANSSREFLESYVGTKDHLLKWREEMRKMQTRQRHALL